MTPLDIAALRLRNQRLVGAPFRTIEDVVRWLGAMQAQEFPVAKWSIAQRAPKLTNAALDDAFAKGEILRTHVLRPTWHFVLPADIRWMVELTGPRIKARMAYYDRQLGLDDAVFRKSNAAIRKALAGGRHRTRKELQDALARAGIPAKTQRLGHLMMRAELDLVVCSGAMQGKQQTYALVEERAPRAKSLPPDEARAELMLRYFTSHGPATLTDYMWWATLSAADARRAVEICGLQLEMEVVDGRRYWLVPQRSRPKLPSPTVHLLQGYDEYVVGYTESKDVLNEEGLAGPAARGQAVFLHAVTIDGQVVGHWKRAEGDPTTLEVRLARALNAAEARGLRAEVERYGRFLEATAALRAEVRPRSRRGS